MSLDFISLLERTGFQKLDRISLTVGPGAPSPGGPLSPGEPWTPGSPRAPCAMRGFCECEAQGTKNFSNFVDSLEMIYDIFIPLGHVGQVLQDFHLIPKRKKEGGNILLFQKRLKAS